MCVRRWTPAAPGRPTAGTTCVIRSDDRSRGAGTDLVVKVSDWLVGNIRRVFMTGDRKAGCGQSRHIERTVKLIFKQGIPQRVLAPPGSQLWERLLADLPPSLLAADEIDIYTDGSWAERHGTLKDVFLYGDGESVKASRGVVLTSHSDN